MTDRVTVYTFLHYPFLKRRGNPKTTSLGFHFFALPVLKKKGEPKNYKSRFSLFCSPGAWSTPGWGGLWEQWLPRGEPPVGVGPCPWGPGALEPQALGMGIRHVGTPRVKGYALCKELAGIRRAPTASDKLPLSKLCS